MGSKMSKPQREQAKADRMKRQGGTHTPSPLQRQRQPTPAPAPAPAPAPLAPLAPLRAIPAVQPPPPAIRPPGPAVCLPAPAARPCRQGPAAHATAPIPRHRTPQPHTPRCRIPCLPQEQTTVGRNDARIHSPKPRKRTATPPAANGPVKPRGTFTLPLRPMADTADEIKSACTAAILDVFPDICPDYLEKTATDLRYDHGQVIDAILGSIDGGKSYPKKSRTKSLKRKRGGSEDADEASKVRRKYDHAGRLRETSPSYVILSKKLLAQDFPRVTMKSITKLFEEKENLLLRTYLALDEINRNWVAGDLQEGFEMKKTRTVTLPRYSETQLDQTIQSSNNPDDKRALEELRAARLVRDAQDAKRNSAKDKERAEEENFKRAQQDGTATECGCCFGDFAMNRMVSCSSPSNEHYFCVDCAKRNAETAIGLSKYELVCMSMDGCSAGFSITQRSMFLDDKLIAALDRIECEAVLRMAGVENLETCPFCPFAAEYPPIEENKEFRCANPECQVVSCRLCREETHIPRTCEEAARENGISARREIEEAMSAALIRKCNKCGTPFIKEEGCNKMTCTRSGCRNVQCYVCSKSCDYSHFDDSSRGGKKGNCPLFEPVKERHDKEVQEAEERTRKKVMDNNPQLDEDLLKFDMSEGIQQESTEKKEAEQRANLFLRRHGVPVNGRHVDVAAIHRPPVLVPNPPKPRVDLAGLPDQIAVPPVVYYLNRQPAGLVGGGSLRNRQEHVAQPPRPPQPPPAQLARQVNHVNHVNGNQREEQLLQQQWWQQWQHYNPPAIPQVADDNEPREAHRRIKKLHSAEGQAQQVRSRPIDFNAPVAINQPYSPVHLQRQGLDSIAFAGLPGGAAIAENNFYQAQQRAQQQMHHAMQQAEQAMQFGAVLAGQAAGHRIPDTPPPVDLNLGQQDYLQPGQPWPSPYMNDLVRQRREIAKPGRTSDDPLELD